MSFAIQEAVLEASFIVASDKWKIPRVSLQNPCDSAWRTVLLFQNDQALITLTGIDFQTVSYIVWLACRFGLLFDTHSPFVDPKGHIIQTLYQVGQV